MGTSAVIRNVEAIPFVLPYRRPFRMATGTIHEAQHVLVRVTSEDGIVGHAEAVSRPMIYGESQASIVSAVQQWFAPQLVGSDAFAVESAQSILSAVVGNETVRGALDIALHDVRARTLGASVWTLLGAAAPSLRLTRMLGLGPVDQVVGEALSAKAEIGISSFKVKVDYDDREAVELMRALREALGDDATLYLDANQSLSIAKAVRLARDLADAGVELLEEPVRATDHDGRARVSRVAGTTIMADESARTAQEAAREIVAGSARALSIKTARTGYTTSARLLGLAEGLHCRTLIGSQGDSALGTITAASFGAAFAATAREPAELEYFRSLTDQIVTDEPHVADGRIYVNQEKPGTGVEIDDDKLNHYRSDR